MTIAGVSLIQILGIANMALIAFQLLSGLRLIKVRMRYHRRAGVALAVTAFVHAVLAYLSGL